MGDSVWEDSDWANLGTATGAAVVMALPAIAVFAVGPVHAAVAVLVAFSASGVVGYFVDQQSAALGMAFASLVVFLGIVPSLLETLNPLLGGASEVQIAVGSFFGTLMIQGGGIATGSYARARREDPDEEDGPPFGDPERRDRASPSPGERTRTRQGDPAPTSRQERAGSDRSRGTRERADREREPER